MDTVFEIKNQIEKCVKDALTILANDFDSETKQTIESQTVEIEVPKDKTHGDFSVNTAMKLTKLLKKNPRELASKIVDSISTDDTYIGKIEIAGPGFINFYLKKSWLYDGIISAYSKGKDFGRTNFGGGK